MKKILLLLIILGNFWSMQAQVSKSVVLSTAGTLSSVLTVDELNTVTNLTLSGNIDARDFKTMRDLMPVLADIDLSGVNIVAYSGMEGTSTTSNYSENVIPEAAFSGKNTLMSAVLGNSIKSISLEAFLGCSTLGSVILPSALETIDSRAFGWCNLATISLPSTLQSIGYYAFSTNNIPKVEIPAGVLNIGASAFYQNRSLTEINVNPANPNYCSIEGVLFNKDHSELMQYPNGKANTNYTIPNGVRKVQSYSFDGGNTNLKNLTIPEGVNEIGVWAFANLRNLEFIEIPSSITVISREAFIGQHNYLQSIKIHKNTPVLIDINVFGDVNKSTCALYVPFGSKAAYQAADQWKDFVNIVEMEPVALTYVPDNNFEQALIDLGYDSGTPDHYVPTANIASVTFLNVSNKGISDLTGIQDFVSLQSLYCFSNKLTSLDVTKNLSLKILTCGSNQLTKLNVTNNTELIQLSCDFNQLTEVDVSRNTALEWLYLYTNNLTSIDVSKNTALTHFSCSYNRLTDLDVSYNSDLTQLTCDYNQLSQLDISNNVKLTFLNCFKNQLKNLDITKNNLLATLNCQINELTSLDVSKNHVLTRLDCSHNLLTSLNIKNGNNANMVGQYNGLNASYNSNLQCIQVDDPALSATYSEWYKDVSASYSSDCSPQTYVPDDNFEQALIDLGYDSGSLDDYVPTENIASVTSLDVSGKGIGDLTGIQDFVSLQQLNCASNNLTTVDISKNTNLQNFSFYSNQLTSLDVSLNSKLQQIYGNNNSITNLDLNKNTLLSALDFGGNDLTNLDLSQNSLLTLLNCSNNQISNIDLTNNTNLEQIAVGGNPISTLDISRNLKLRWFYAQSTMLDKIDCSNHKALESIDCSRNNHLMALNLKNGNNAILKSVFAIENPGLSCIQVDDPSLASTYSDWKIDAQASYSSNCAVPVANAGIDQNVNAGTSVVLDGSLSFDSYGDPLTYTWTAPAGIVLNMEDPARPTFVAPNVNRERSFSFSLVVSDGLVNSIADAINVTVKPINAAPILVLNSLIVKLDASGNYNLSLTDLKSLVAGTTDDKDSFKNLKIVAEPSYFSCANVGAPVNVKLTVTDSEGASSSGYSLINVSDVTPPAFSSITKNYSAVMLSGENYILPDFSMLYPATDACSNISYTQFPAPGKVYTSSTKEMVALNAADIYGNNTKLSISFVLNVRSKLKSAEVDALNQISDAVELDVYPNPFKDRVYFVLTSPKETNATLEIFSSTGIKLKTLFSGKLEENQTYNFDFSANDAPSQLLFYKFSTDNEQKTGKLILEN